MKLLSAQGLSLQAVTLGLGLSFGPTTLAQTPASPLHETQSAAGKAMTGDSNKNPKIPSKQARKVVNNFAFRVTRSLGCGHLDEAILSNGRELWKNGSQSLSEATQKNILWDYLESLCGSTRSACYMLTKSDLIDIMDIYRNKNIDNPITQAVLNEKISSLKEKITKVNRRRGYAKIRCKISEAHAVAGLVEAGEDEESEKPAVTGSENPDQDFSEGLNEEILEQSVSMLFSKMGCGNLREEISAILQRIRPLAQTGYDAERFKNFTWAKATEFCKNDDYSCVSEIYFGVRKVIESSLEGNAELQEKGIKQIEAFVAKHKKAVCEIKPVDPQHGQVKVDPPKSTPAAPDSSPALPSPRSGKISSVIFPSPAGETRLDLENLNMGCPDNIPKVCFHGDPHRRSTLVLDPGHDDRSHRNEYGKSKGYSPHVHEGQQNMVTALLFRHLVKSCLAYDAKTRGGVIADAIQMSRWPGEARYGEYEDAAKASSGGYLREKANDHLKRQINSLMRKGTALINNVPENAYSSTFISFHANAGTGTAAPTERPEVFYMGSQSTPLAQQMQNSLFAIHSEAVQKRRSDYKIVSRSLKVLGTGTSQTHKVLLEPYFMDAKGSLAEQANREIASGSYEFLRARVTQDRSGKRLDNLLVGPANKHPKTGAADKGYFVPPTFKKVAAAIFNGFVNTYRCDAPAKVEAQVTTGKRKK